MATGSPSPRLGFDLAPNEMQWSIKSWLGLPLKPEVGVCAYCPDKALDAHHAVTCKFWGDVVARHNTLIFQASSVEPKTGSRCWFGS